LPFDLIRNRAQIGEPAISPIQQAKASIGSAWSIFAFPVEFRAPSFPFLSAERVGHQRNPGLHYFGKRSDNSLQDIRRFLDEQPPDAFQKVTE
jgi:hypothetical protein